MELETLKSSQIKKNVSQKLGEQKLELSQYTNSELRKSDTNV